MNDVQFQNLCSEGKTSLTINAQHLPASHIPTSRSKESERILFSMNPSRNVKAFKTPSSLDFCIGSTVMLTRNLGTEIGLVNGAIGKIHAFGLSQREDPPIVFVDFPSMSIDSNLLGKSKIIPLTLMQSTETLKANNVTYYRWQLPLLPAAAMTTHKAQGMTAKNDVVYAPTSGKRPFCRGLEYVAISRCPSVNKLFLLHHLRPSHFTCYFKQNQETDNFYENLRRKFQQR